MKRSDLHTKTIGDNIEATINRFDGKVIVAMGSNITIGETTLKVRAFCSGHSIPYEKIESITYKTIPCKTTNHGETK